jgi:DNA-binding response OmpR family regulator
MRETNESALVLRALSPLEKAEPGAKRILAGMCGSELCQRLLDRKVIYPIIVNSSWDETEQRVREFANQGLNVSFLPLPCDCASLWNLVDAALKIRCEGLQRPVTIAPQPRRTRPLRIVMLDDEPLVLDATKMLLHYDYNNAKILTFTDAEEALQELTREDPDLFTTDWNHPGILHGDGLLQLLAARKVKYPIFLMSASIESIRATEFLRKYEDQGLNITFLPKPFTLEELRPMLLKHFGPSDNPERQIWKEAP